MTCFWDKFWDGESIRLPFAFTLLCLYHIHTSFCSHARFISMLDVALSLIAFVMDVGLLKFFYFFDLSEIYGKSENGMGPIGCPHLAQPGSMDEKT